MKRAVTSMILFAGLALSATTAAADHAKNYCECIVHVRQPGWKTDPGYNADRIAACTKNFGSSKPPGGACGKKKKQ